MLDMENPTKPDMRTEDELLDSLGGFPTSAEIEELVNALDVHSLRGMSSAILTAGVDYSEGRLDKPAYRKILNSWVSTAEETVAAGEDIDAILARRKGKATDNGWQSVKHQ